MINYSEYACRLRIDAGTEYTALTYPSSIGATGVGVSVQMAEIEVNQY
jgi:hypothetical protein